MIKLSLGSLMVIIRGLGDNIVMIFDHKLPSWSEKLLKTTDNIEDYNLYISLQTRTMTKNFETLSTL
jgi:hypothetical protein